MLYLTTTATALLVMLSCMSVTERSGAEHDIAICSELPSPIDSTGRYLFYFHARIIEDQGLPAVSPEYGEYRYDAILERLTESGFSVISEVRPRNADVTVYAERAVAQIDSLLSLGVPAGHITLVGASKGAYIAALTSHLAWNSRLNVVLLAGCSAGTVSYMLENDVDLYGDVLAIRDVADTERAGSCAEVFDFSEGIDQRHEIVLNVGTGHGIIFRPLDEWVLPTVAWAEEPE